ncbi:cupin-like domain-containing protein [Croceibacterium sp. LX-88]|uniref:Cupin-like domain-containing protein n=1 Tax=Croceibacterium selenioxidans TaxID=2838833 RepID=A0ABS5W6S3_9SPHN|nr:cupin-like domain-containing protein [Croceibacterium selenioxidans]MBT2134940.1 cupin-like domain-containing protein [Croceibacterium selenioxidans]
MPALPEHAAPTPEDFTELCQAGRPFVMRGLASGWPLVQAGQDSPAATIATLAAMDSGKPADVMLAPPETGGRFFYGADMRGFNFVRQKAPLAEVGRKLLELATEASPPIVYAGANETREHLPRFDVANPLPHAAMQRDAKSRVWLCNKAEVATHFDLSDNIAVVVLGRRRFTLFPPQATGDLYVGPLNNTLAGQPISLPDPLRPDLEAYPRFARALELAQSAELAPGDAIFIPTLWWHHVAALDAVNVLVNYWYNDVARGGPFVALIHALSAIRDLPDTQREGWRAWFEHFVFAPDAARAADHLPPHAQGVNGPASPERDEMIRQFLLRVLSGS